MRPKGATEKISLNAVIYFKKIENIKEIKRTEKFVGR